jgi:uncharacterized membrane protein (UPF0127 family)
MVLSIGKNDFNPQVISSPDRLRTGMQGKTFDGFDSMLFIMPKDEEQSFWMKDCIVPLDIVFISHGYVEDISPNCPVCNEVPCPSYKGKGGFVLELPAGACREKKIKIGDRVDFM